VSVEKRLVIGHLDVDREASLYPPVEVDQVRVGVVEEGLRRREAERNRQPAAERLDEAAMRVRRPQLPQMRNLPALAAGPLQRRSRRDNLAIG
jgi:hypothetical protein